MFPPLNEPQNVALFPVFMTSSSEAEGWGRVADKLRAREQWLSGAALESARRFINSELDCRTNGKKGLGRSTTHVPRLAGWKHADISRLNDQDRAHLYMFIEQLVIGGYGVFHSWLLDHQDVSKVPTERLFEQWIPLIYIDWETQISPDARRSLANTRKIYTDIFSYQYQEVLRLRTGWLWGRVTFETIAGFYFTAGACLANVEQGVADFVNSSSQASNAS